MEGLARVNIIVGSLVLGVVFGVAAAPVVTLPEVQRRAETHQGLVQDLGTCRQALAAETDQAQRKAVALSSTAAQPTLELDLSACRQWLTTAVTMVRPMNSTAVMSTPDLNLIVQSIPRHDACEGAAFRGVGTFTAAL